MKHVTVPGTPHLRSDRQRMNEYKVSFTAPQHGGILLDVHSCTGTSRYADFRSSREVRKFFSSLGLHQEKVAEIDAICSNLHAGEAYHENMFLPEFVIDAIQRFITQTDATVNIQIPPVQLALPRSA
jgi:hypothetical protein